MPQSAFKTKLSVKNCAEDVLNEGMATCCKTLGLSRISMDMIFVSPSREQMAFNVTVWSVPDVFLFVTVPFASILAYSVEVTNH